MNLKNALIMAFGVALLGSTSALHAADAVLVQKTGTVTVTLPNGSSKELSQGDMIPEGSTVTTSADGRAFVEPASGIVATLEAGTKVKVAKIQISQDSAGTVTKQDVLLDLEQGNLTSTLDPEKRAVNDYKVQTPKGVAAARGTGFTCSVTDAGTTIAVTADAVTFSSSSGSISIASGNVTYTPAGGGAPVTVALASIASSPNATAIQAMLTQAVTATSAVIQNNLGGLGTAGATTLLTEVVGAASVGNPTQAATYASTAATAAVAPGSATASAGAQVAADVAAAAATANPSAAGTIAASVVAATGGSATVAGTVTAAVSSATGQSQTSIATSIVAQNSSLSVASVTSAAATAATTTTVQSQAATVSQNVSNISSVVTPINVSTVSPSS